MWIRKAEIKMETVGQERHHSGQTKEQKTQEESEEEIFGEREMDGHHKNGSLKKRYKKWVTEWMLCVVFMDLYVQCFAVKINVMKNLILLHDRAFVTGII